VSGVRTAELTALRSPWRCCERGRQATMFAAEDLQKIIVWSSEANARIASGIKSLDRKTSVKCRAPSLQIFQRVFSSFRCFPSRTEAAPYGFGHLGGHARFWRLSTGWTVPLSSVTNCVVQAPGGQSNVVASQCHSARFPWSVPEHLDTGLAGHMGAHFVYK